MEIVSGYAAIKVGRYWVGCIEGNIYCNKNRLSSQKALEDAKKKYIEYFGILAWRKKYAK